MGKKGFWVCQNGRKTTLPVSVAQLPAVDRDIAPGGGCPANSTAVNGICAACSGTSMCNPYVSSDPNLPPYFFYQVDGSVSNLLYIFFVPFTMSTTYIYS